MSNRRRLPDTSPASMAIRSLDGAAVSGGCNSCDAYQVVNADKYGPGAHQIAVMHDDWCPELARHQGRTS